MELQQSSATNMNLPPISHALQNHVNKVTSSIIAEEKEKNKQTSIEPYPTHNIIKSNAEDSKERK